MAITPHQLSLFTNNAVDIYRAMEIEIFTQIANRLKSNPNQPILEWQAEKLAELHLLNESTVSELRKLTGLTRKKIVDAFYKSGYATVEDIDKELKTTFKPLPLPSNLDEVIKSYINQVFTDLDNFVNQTLLTTNYGMSAITKLYNDIVNEVTAKYMTGMLTLDQAVAETILKWSSQGIKSTFIDKGGHTWSMERYVDTVLKSTLQRTYNDLRMSRMSEYGINTVVMSSLRDSAPRCQGCQGKVLDMRPQSEADSGYPSIYGFGYPSAGATLGVNCRHQVFPFIPGVNENNQPHYESKEVQKAYKNEQKRRDLARAIRKTKKNLIVAKELDSEVANRYQATLRRQQARMRVLCEETGIKRNYRLEKVYTPKEILMNEAVLDDF